MPRKKTVETEVVWEETPDGVTFPEGWRWVKLGEVANYINGRAFKPAEWEKSGKKIIRIQNLNNSNASYNYTTKEIEEKYRVVKGDLLFAWSASLGVHVWNDDDAWLNQHIFRVEPYNLIEKTFLRFFLDYMVLELYSKAHGSGMVHVTKGVFESTLICLPPLPTQQKIVAKIEALFTELDAGVEKLKAAQQQLKVYRQAVLKAAFEGELTNTEYIEWQQLSDVVESVQYGSSAKSMESGDVPVIRMGNIQNGKIDWTDLVFTNDKYEISKYLLSDQDVLFNRTNSPELVGKTAIYSNEMQAIYAGYLIKINYDKSKIIGKYLNFFLNSPVAKNYSNTVKTDGVNQSNINGKKLLTYPFPFTPVHIQQSIVTAIETRLTACEAMEKEIEVQLSNAMQLRQSILKKAFSGELIA